MKKPHLWKGLEATRSRRFTAAEIAEYRELSGDVGLVWNGIPGPLLAGMISDLLGTELLGEGTMWMKQRMSFPAPAPLGEPVDAVVEVVRLRPDKNLVNLLTTCRCGDAVVLAGEALVLVPELAGRIAGE